MWVIPNNLGYSKGDNSVLDSDTELSLLWKSDTSTIKTWNLRCKREMWINTLFNHIMVSDEYEKFNNYLSESWINVEVNPNLPIEGTNTVTISKRLSFFEKLSLPNYVDKTPFNNMTSEQWDGWLIYQKYVYKERCDVNKNRWQTPTVTDSYSITRSPDAVQKRIEYRKSIGRSTIPPAGLYEQVTATWPTPSAGMWKQESPNIEYNKKIHNRGGQIMLPAAVKLFGADKTEYKKQLNSNWVEQLQGLEIGTTQIEDIWNN